MSQIASKTLCSVKQHKRGDHDKIQMMLKEKQLSVIEKIVTQVIKNTKKSY